MDATNLELGKDAKRDQSRLFRKIANINEWTQYPVYNVDKEFADEEYRKKNVVKDCACHRKPVHVL